MWSDLIFANEMFFFVVVFNCCSQSSASANQKVFWCSPLNRTVQDYSILKIFHITHHIIDYWVIDCMTRFRNPADMMIGDQTTDASCAVVLLFNLNVIKWLSHFFFQTEIPISTFPECISAVCLFPDNWSLSWRTFRHLVICVLLVALQIFSLITAKFSVTCVKCSKMSFLYKSYEDYFVKPFT